jgi:hypothetical protein
LIEHVVILGVISLVRSVIECAAGVYLIVAADRWSIGNALFELRAIPDDADRLTFSVVGQVLVALAIVRAVQSIGSLDWRDWARKLGIALGAVDLLLPVTLPLALWSFVVYPNQETRDRFRRLSRAT